LDRSHLRQGTDVVIDGKTPTPNTRMKLIIDNEIMEIPVNEQGYIDTGCATCADTFEYVWHRLRAATAIAVKFKDDSYAGFLAQRCERNFTGKCLPD
jgi:hypothetical protein